VEDLEMDRMEPKMHGVTIMMVQQLISMILLFVVVLLSLLLLINYNVRPPR